MSYSKNASHKIIGPKPGKFLGLGKTSSVDLMILCINQRFQFRGNGHIAQPEQEDGLTLLLCILQVPDNHVEAVRIDFDAREIQRDGIVDLIHKYKLEDILSVSGLPAHAGVAFEGHGSLSYLDIQSVYSQVMLQNGILVFAIYNLNASHTEKEAAAYLEATDKAFALIRKAVDADSLGGILHGGKVDPIFKRNIK